MRLIPLAAPLIRLAAVDDDYAQDLHDAVDADRDTLMSGLVEAEVGQADLAELTPPQWQWYATWRQERGGGLNRVLLDHLAASASTRFARFQVRELVLRDPETNAAAPLAMDPAAEVVGVVGLEWLSEQARGTESDNEALELMRDSLQCATAASWFLLRQLTFGRDDRSDLVRTRLDEIAEDGRITARWYERGIEPEQGEGY
ncbi:hypothetical protein [Mycobacterium sp. E787]|uniref:hypothetical protein n=1 Tax=Mycobacterium sp. E787 TaxID=1834150 RepID=UPI0007FD7E2B|nr:hypothetical protein [Mycobacterium sp. E787]OBI52737.1 hypothetical protein A5705_05155 [Mycobacterium sp. E787]